ncbi:MAG: 2-hydroxyacyl-CoA dehydratase family protein, partial [Candidatus Bathyarchaeota archaeon]|nr:2-hydroxyacyl-CoA dehydratase family protein [Candidatus Bathyarchaeota archaeon]
MASEIEVGSKYIPEMSQKEIEELGSSIKAASIKAIKENIERMKKTWPNRPKTMEYFDEISNFFGRREKEIREQKETGKKLIGYSCMFAPIELILAADAIPVRIGSGWYDAAKLGDRIMPVEVCPVIRSTVGAKMVNLSPYLELSDAIINPLTCDGRTKLSEILSDYKPIWYMSPPRVKDDPQSLSLWKEEMQVIKGKIEELTGTKINRKNLKSSIEVMQRATKAFRRLQDLRKGSPVITGRDAMLVTQT